MSNRRVILEMPGVNVQEPIHIVTSTGRTVDVDRLDMRFEDMVKQAFCRVGPFDEWAAKLPGEERWLVNDGRVVDEPPEGYKLLPDGWWEYVVGTFHDRLVKAPKLPRDWQGEVHQEVLDQETKAESLSRALDRVLIDGR